MALRLPPRLQQAVHGQARGRACQLRQHEAWHARGADAGEAVAEHAAQRRRRIRERGRGSEPVGRADVARDHRRGPAGRRAKDHQQQAGRGHRLGEPLAGTAAHLGRELPERQIEHRVRQPGAQDRAGQLRCDVGCQHRRRQLAAHGHHGTYRRIEMGAAHRPEHLDQHVQAGDRGQRVGKQRDRRVAAREALGHDARADHDRQQQPRAQRLGGQLAAQRGHAFSSARCRPAAPAACGRPAWQAAVAAAAACGSRSPAG